MAKKKQSWILIIVSVAAFVVIVGGGLVAVAGYYVYRQFDVHTQENASPEAANKAFAEVLERYKGQTPYLEVKDGGGTVVHKEQEGTERKTITDLHIIGWDDRDQTLFQLTMPFWLLQLGGNRPIRVNQRGSGGNFLDLEITARDLERRGPGLLLDRTDRRGRRVLVWAE